MYFFSINSSKNFSHFYLLKHNDDKLQQYSFIKKIFKPSHIFIRYFFTFSESMQQEIHEPKKQIKQEAPKTQEQTQTQAKNENDKKKQVHSGIFIADERKKGNGGFIKCKSLDKKIEVNLRRDDDIILHQTEVEWVKITQYNRKERREKRKEERERRNKQRYKKTDNKPKFQSKYEEKQQPKLKYKLKEEIPQQNQKAEQKPVQKKGYKPKYAEKKIQTKEEIKKQNQEKQIEKQIEKLSIEDKNTQRQAEKKQEQAKVQKKKQNVKSQEKQIVKMQEKQENKQEENDQEREEQESSESEEEGEDKGEEREKNQEEKKAKKKEDDDIVIVGKITNKKSCLYWDKPFVAIMQFQQIKRKGENLKYKAKNQNQSHVQKIFEDFYLDAQPIHPRLPVFEINRNKQSIKIVEEYIEKNIKYDPEAKGGKIRNKILDEMESIYCLLKFSRIEKSMAYCDLLKIIGKTKTIDGECNCFLYEHELNDFGHDLQAIEKEEIGLNVSPLHKKYDEMVFTIDPPTSTDLDDALSIKKISENEYQIGIHIADVSQYLKHIDREQIVKRTTSVYLPHLTYHMLPSYLVKICSLNPNVERLAFSIFVRMNKEGQIIGESRLEKNIVKSRFKLSYYQVQDIITGKSSYEQFNAMHPCDPKQFEILTEKIEAMTQIGIAHRNKRMVFDVFENREIKFELDENKWPVTFTIESRFTAQKIVEEYMIIGNIEAAKKLVSLNPKNALIIHHPKPSAYAVKTFNQMFEFMGIDFKFENIRQVQEDLLKVEELKDISKEKKQLCYFKARRVQQTAGYKLYSQVPETSSIQQKQPIIHFALGLPFYTHFTSPMRRIGDIIVHQTLTASLMPQKQSILINEKQIEQANWGRTGTKRLKKDLNDIFLCLLIYNQKKKIQCDGIISSFGGKSVSIFIPMFDMMKEVYWHELDVHKAYRNKETDQIEVTVYYDKRDAKKDIIWKIQKFQKIGLVVDCTQDPPLRLTFNLQVNTNKGLKKIRSEM